jgi:hypothetical protein
MRNWVNKHTPSVIVCVGKSYLDDFTLAFADENLDLKRETIDDREFSWVINNTGTLVVILPFMVNRNGLTKNTSIQKVGERIGQLIRSQLD